ncbi:Hypothetical predicted protein [Scomber scombrus]|uniref:Uncharacterized protein n=1 Tax=Scomber scombrus TaxID=13677 RepID=A0AAV1N2H5_SCOSC
MDEGTLGCFHIHNEDISPEKHSGNKRRLKLYFLKTAGRGYSEATDDIPRNGICDSAVATLSQNLWCMDSRQKEVHTSGCQECQVAAMWLCISSAALRHAHAA